MSDIRDNHLLWVDLETTGSNLEKDNIIEVGAILTTSDLVVIDEFEQLVRPDDRAFGRMMRNPVVREMHEANGLLEDMEKDDSFAVRPVNFTGQMMVEWLKGNGAKEGKVVLAGSGVGHFDKRFIDKYMPRLSHFCRYWVIDTGVLRRATEMWTGEVVSDANSGKTHRALDDIRCHLQESREFRGFLRRAMLYEALRPRMVPA